MKRTLLAATALLLISTAAASAMQFTIPSNVSAGHMNVRNGPGANHGLIGTIPAGQTISASRCVPRDDGIAGADWCLVNWGGLRGWVSQAGLMPVIEEPAPVNNASRYGGLICDAPIVTIGDQPDNDPIESVEVQYSGPDHAWRIFHYARSGLVISRGEQYAVQDASNDRKAQWQGSLNRNRSLWMVGEARRDESGHPVYMEWLYDRAKNNALVMQMTAQCHKAPQAISQAIPRPTN